MNNILDVQSLYDRIIRKRARYNYMVAQNQSISLNGVRAYFFRDPKSINAFDGLNFTLRRSSLTYMLAIEYPLFITTNFPSLPNYYVGSHALGFSIYGEKWLGRLQSTIELVFSTASVFLLSNSKQNTLDNIDLQCVCYDNKAKMVTAKYCSKVTKVTTELVTCGCNSDQSLCYLNYKLNNKQWMLIIEVLCPICGIGTLLVVIIYIRRRRHSRENTRNTQETEEACITTKKVIGV